MAKNGDTQNKIRSKAGAVKQFSAIQSRFQMFQYETVLPVSSIVDVDES